MKSYLGKTVEEALEIAAQEAGVPVEKLIYSVSDKKKGLFSKKVIVDVYDLSDIIQYAEDYVLGVIDSLGIESKVISIVVDRIEPIGMDDIVDISNKINAYIDEIDDSITPYTLDISSLGAEKPLHIDELDKYVNRFVHIHLINPIDGENIYEGDLVEVTSESIKISFRIKTRIKTVDINKSNISKARLAIKF